MSNTPKQPLSLEETDTIIALASPKDGAIEDCEVGDAAIVYLFETGTIGTVCRTTGAVTHTQENA
jgi:hypothetical protein